MYKVFIGIVFLAIMLVLVFLNYARAEINPQDLISNWRIIQVAPYFEGTGLYQSLLMNPDPDAEVKLVYMICFPKTDKDGVIQKIVVRAYYYEENGVKYAFVYNKFTKKLVQKSPIPI